MCASCAVRKAQSFFQRYTRKHPSRANGRQVCDHCWFQATMLRYAGNTNKRLARVRKRLKQKRVAQIVAEVYAHIAQRKQAVPTPDASAPKEKYVYACPFCTQTVTSRVYTGKVNHYSVCGHQFRVVEGDVTRMRYDHHCPRCGTIITTSKSSGRVQSKHRTPKGKQCPQTQWVVKG